MSADDGKNLPTLPIGTATGNSLFEKSVAAVGLDEAATRWLLVSILNTIGAAPATLDHPNCVAVQDFGRLPDGSLFLVMSHLEGVLLRAALDAGPFSVARALHVARHVLAGLAHAHQAGIVHRDVKPENVMLVR